MVSTVGVGGGVEPPRVLLVGPAVALGVMVATKLPGSVGPGPSVVVGVSVGADVGPFVGSMGSTVADGSGVGVESPLSPPVSRGVGLGPSVGIAAPIVGVGAIETPGGGVGVVICSGGKAVGPASCMALMNCSSVM